MTAPLLGAAAGVALPSGTVTPDAAKVLVTFLGLVAASVLPTITLLVNTTSADGRSVRGVQSLTRELSATIKTLFSILVLVGASVLALLALSTPTPWHFSGLLSHDSFREHIGQTISLALLFETLNRTRAIPRSIFRCLAIRSGVAKDDARQKIADNAPNAGEAASLFKKKPGFGVVKTLSDVR